MARRRIGTIETMPDGRKRARMRVDGKLATIGTYASDEDAEAALVLFAEGLREKRPTAGHTLKSWGEVWLDARELDGVHRSVQRDRFTWRRVAAAPFASLPLAAITSRDVRNWIAETLRTVNQRTGERPARQTVANALNLCRVALEGAIEAGHLEANPARDVRVPRVARTDDRWTWLKADEIGKLLSDRTEDDQRDLYTVAIYTGLRAGELFGLEWRDVDLKRATATIRHSWNRTPTKRGELRTLHLFAPVVEALERQHARSVKCSHVFPARDGQPRTRDQMPRLGAALEAVGVKRPVRFHDLRHTCASHLVSGTWGRAWTLEEVAKHLGHSTSATTRRYAHLCPEGLAKAARETLVQRSSKDVPESQRAPTCGLSQVSEISGEGGIRTPGREHPSPVFKTRRGSVSERAHSLPDGTLAGRARALLIRLQTGECTSDEVAELAADYLAQPDPIRRAAERFGALIGTEHEGMAAAEFMGLLAASVDVDDFNKKEGGGR